MKSKWFIGSLFAILMLLGLGNYQNSAPNQEIVVHFNNDDVASTETQKAISIVEKQLIAVGVQDIQIHKLSNGNLVIAYHSNLAVERIKDIFSKDKNLQIGLVSNSKEKNPTEIPSKENTNSINLDVYEIQNDTNIDHGVKGYVLDLKPENDRSFNPNIYVFVDVLEIDKRDRFEKTVGIFNTNAIAISTTSHEIPEVRAGPSV